MGFTKRVQGSCISFHKISHAYLINGTNYFILMECIIPNTARVTSLEQKFTAFEQKSKNLDNTTQNLGSRVFTLELRDPPHKIDEAIRENVKEAIH
ncbi:hypothetical protein Tco_1334137, partial [Tanacetum coccineum]